MEFDEDFEEEFIFFIGYCVVIYYFEGFSEGIIFMVEGEDFSFMEEDKGDGWIWVRWKEGGEGYVFIFYF